jgi:hypothetical protein
LYTNKIWTEQSKAVAPTTRIGFDGPYGKLH